MDFLYVISNPAWPGWFKIGKAIDVNKRLKNYLTYSPNRDYKVEFSIEVENAQKYENHFMSLDCSKSEWINMELSSIIQIIEGLRDGKIFPQNKKKICYTKEERKELTRPDKLLLLGKLTEENMKLREEVRKLKAQHEAFRHSVNTVLKRKLIG